MPAFDSYSGAVAKLLTHSRPIPKHHTPSDWPDYIEELGLTDADIPELIRLATDPAIANAPSDRIEVWSAVHAWRSLAQLQAPAAAEPLLSLLGNEADDWITEEMPWVYGLIGPSTIPILAQYLQSAAQNLWGRMTSVSCLRAIAEEHAEGREEAITVLITQLKSHHQNGEELNGLLITELIELKATEAAPIIEQAYRSGEVDELMAGTWPDCQVSLGLKNRSEFSEADFQPQMPPELEEIKRLGRWADDIKAAEGEAENLGELLSDRSLSDALPRASQGFSQNGHRGPKQKKGNNKK